MSICAPWDAAASETIVQLAQGGPDIDVRRVSEAVAAMRRARRHCELGWFRFACLEYDAIIRGVVSRTHAGPAPQMCWPVMLDPPANLMTRR
jgi:hypothetical protein